MKVAWAELQNQDKFLMIIYKRKDEDDVTVTVKLACDKDIAAAECPTEYSQSFSESAYSVSQECQQSLVILITQEKNISIIFL